MKGFWYTNILLNPYILNTFVILFQNMFIISNDKLDINSFKVTWGHNHNVPGFILFSPYTNHKKIFPRQSLNIFIFRVKSSDLIFFLLGLSHIVN